MDNNTVTKVPAVNLVETAAAHGSFTVLGKAIVAADMTDVLRGTGPYTVFAPTDEAFGKLPGGTLENWLKPENKAELISVLKYHVLPGRASSVEVAAMARPRMMQGQSTNIVRDGDKLSIDGANVVVEDIVSSNGVIHAIDAVLHVPKNDAKH